VFNLLLANSSKSGHLVYIFSQPTLHDFLFERINIERESEETVEYFVQLLKTLILKVSGVENKSMIKLFCNGRFPHFPLLTTVVMLGVDLRHEELVRVTASQCVLLLIKLLNDTHLGLEYLSEIQMVIYFHELLDSLFEAGQEEREEHMRFIVDLILSLRNNQAALSVFMNLLTNHLLFRHAHQTHHILHFLSFLHDSLSEHAQFPT
jgi:hypothetical protein